MPYKSTLVKCSDCDGNGRIMVHGIEDCPDCRGSGKNLWGRNCSSCSGYGWVYATQECSRCNGYGEYRDREYYCGDCGNTECSCN